MGWRSLWVVPRHCLRGYRDVGLRIPVWAVTDDVVWVPYSVWWGMPGDNYEENMRGVFPSHRYNCDHETPPPHLSVPPISGMIMEHARFLYDHQVDSRRSRPGYRAKFTYDVLIEFAIPKREYAKFLLMFDIDLIDNGSLYR